MNDGGIKSLMRQGVAIRAAMLRGCSFEEIVGPILDSDSDTRNDADTRNFCELLLNIAAVWAYDGFPTVEPGAKLAASFMATRAEGSDVNGLRLPWHTFGIRVPKNLLKAIEFAVVFKKPQHITLLTHSSVINSWEGADYTMEQLASDAPIAPVGIAASNVERLNHQGMSVEDYYSEFERSHILLKRLVVGVIAEMNSVPASSLPSIGNSGPKMKRGEPVSLTYQLTRPVKLDLRENVRSFEDGVRTGPLSMQFVVRGHWKNQPHGPQRSRRKLIHVEPYWKGPEDAPIAVRAHQLGAGE